MSKTLFCTTKALEALELDRTLEDSLFFDILKDKIFSRFGALTDELRKATEESFLKRNVSAGLWALGRTYTGPIPTEILCEDVSEVRRTLLRLADNAYYTEPHIGDVLRNGFKVRVDPTAVGGGPGSTTASIGKSYSSIITKCLDGDQSVGSKELYATYVKLIRAGSTPLQDYVAMERFRVHNYKTSVGPQSLIVIPQNHLKGRCISPQNGIDLAVQKELASRLTSALLDVLDIDLATQPVKNSSMARRGSIDETFATLDLSAASDSITVEMVKMLFAGHPILRQLLDSRNPSISVGGREITMHIYAGMGNDVTFPLQTSIFTAIARVASKRCGRRGGYSFGDDIIVHDSAAQYCVELLSYLGFSVNVSKSFWSLKPDGTRFFRESCGGYFLCGRDIAPFRIDRMDTSSDAYTAINLAVDCMARTGIHLRNLISYIECFIEDYQFVPPWFPVDSGIRAPASYCMPQLKLNSDGWEYYDTMRLVTRSLNVALEPVTPDVAHLLCYAAFQHGAQIKPIREALRVYRRSDQEPMSGSYTNLYAEKTTGLIHNRDGTWCVQRLISAVCTPMWVRMKVMAWDNPQVFDFLAKRRNKYKNSPSCSLEQLSLALAKL